MAERRMFSKTIVDSDAFLNMPLSTQALYFHLGMRADDDGFINNPTRTQRLIGAADDDLKLLVAKGFIIPFESGVVVITHWKIHNYIQNDRYKATICTKEKALLSVEDNKSYALCGVDTECIQDGYNSDTQVRIGKDSVGKNSTDKRSIGDSDAQSAPRSRKSSSKNRKKYGEYLHVLLSDDEYQRLIDDYGETTTAKYIKKVDEYCEIHGKSYKNYNLVVRKFLNGDNVRKIQNVVTQPIEQIDVAADYYKSFDNPNEPKKGENNSGV